MANGVIRSKQKVQDGGVTKSTGSIDGDDRNTYSYSVPELGSDITQGTNVQFDGSSRGGVYTATNIRKA